MKITLTPNGVQRLMDINKAFQAQALLSQDDNAKSILFDVTDDCLLVIGRAPSMGFTFSMNRSDYSSDETGRFVVTTDSLHKALASFVSVDSSTTIDISTTHAVFSATRKKMKIDRRRVDNDFALPKRINVENTATSSVGTVAELNRVFALVKGNRYKEDFAADSVFAGVLISLAPDGVAMFAANTSSIAQAATEGYVENDAFAQKIVDPRLVPSVLGCLSSHDKANIRLTDRELIADQETPEGRITVSLALLNFSVDSMRRPQLLKQAGMMVSKTNVFISVEGAELVSSMQEAASIDRASVESVQIKISGDRIAIRSMTNGIYGAEISGIVKRTDSAPTTSDIEVGSTNLKSMVSKKSIVVLRMVSAERSGQKVPIVLIGDDDGTSEPDLTKGWFMIETAVSK